MYSAQPNGADSATINPAALNSAELLNPASRGVKRSRSPETYQGAGAAGSAGDDGDKQARKRGRPMKTGVAGGAVESPGQAPPVPAPGRTAQGAPQTIPPPQTPQNQNTGLPPVPPPASYAPPQASPPPPPKTTPTKSTLKALPTVRDHTTDQLGPGNDEYLPREIDEAGEKKVLANGQLTGGRTYKCRTFLVPHRGDKLFMLATECARVLGYRDSYLLFNKNRSLFKIIANQVEKDDLVAQEILPFSYRSRQIAIVTARSMFRQFGSRVIVDGRRVRDDYWETKARKQGFTEADLAGEKRPGAAKAREAAAEASQHAAMLGAPHGEIVYSTTPGQFGAGPQPQLVPPDYNDGRSRDYSNILKTAPRQEITGPAYQDRTTTAPLPELHAQSHHVAEFNRSVNQQREIRGDYLQTMWRRPHEQPSSGGLSQPAGSEPSIPTSRAAQSPHSMTAGLQQQPPPQQGQPGQSPQLMMTAAPYAQSIHAQTPIGQASLRGSTSNLSQPQGGYSYPPANQMWPPTPQTPQQQGYSYTTQPQTSQHPQQTQGPQMRHSSTGGGVVQTNSMQYPGVPSINPGYGGGSQGMYPADQTPRGYMHQGAATGPPAVTQAWSQHQQTPAQWWSNQPQ